MQYKMLLFTLLSLFFINPLHAARSLPAGVQPESIKGVATGNFTFSGSFSGTSSLTFINTGGDAHLKTMCDASTVDTAAGERCEGIDLDGTFTGGPNGTAEFTTESGGHIIFQLEDGKVFSFAVQGISMKLTVTDPSIFDDWVETSGARDSGARASDLSGQVEIACPPNLEAWDVMKMGRVILIDCHLKTGEDSSAVISFSDQTTFVMKPESEIAIDTPPAKDSKWKLLVGDIWVNVKQMVKDGTMKGHMSQAVAGIKGTTFILHETGTESTIKVLEGTVNFESSKTTDSVDVKPGESVTATSTGLSQPTTFDPNIEAANWGKTLDTPSNPSTSAETKSKNTQALYYGGGLGAVILLVIVWVALKRQKTHFS